MKSGILFFVALFFQAAFVQASEASELTPFYKSWLKERSYVHPTLRTKSQPPAGKTTTQSKARASAKTATTKVGKSGKEPFYKSWLQERSYAHPGITSRAAVSTPTKSISKATSNSKGKRSAPKYKSRPEFNICKFVCLSTCKTCSNKSSSNYLMSKE